MGKGLKRIRGGAPDKEKRKAQISSVEKVDFIFLINGYVTVIPHDSLFTRLALTFLLRNGGKYGDDLWGCMSVIKAEEEKGYKTVGRRKVFMSRSTSIFENRCVLCAPYNAQCHAYTALAAKGQMNNVT
jgi:hypothetical protein